MSYIKAYLHFVWSTKNRIPLLKDREIRKTIWHHILENGRSKGIFIDSVNGYHDHCHCLVSLGSNQTIEKIAQMIKGESSFWINKQKWINTKFEWQDEYFATSVSESLISKVREYIFNQEIHHQSQTFNEETDLLVKNYGFKIAK
jgi:REP element-mobilizing transposase RayT